MYGRYHCNHWLIVLIYCIIVTINIIVIIISNRVHFVHGCFLLCLLFMLLLLLMNVSSLLNQLVLSSPLLRLRLTWYCFMFRFLNTPTHPLHSFATTTTISNHYSYTNGNIIPYSLIKYIIYTPTTKLKAKTNHTSPYTRLRIQLTLKKKYLEWLNNKER